MILTDEEKRMLAGEEGPGVQRAMEFLVEYGEAFGAQRMAKVDSVHSLTDPEEWLNKLLEGVERIKVNVATLHSMLTAYETKWAKPLGISEQKASKAMIRVLPLLERYIQIGYSATMTCAPYLVGNVLTKGGVFCNVGSQGIILNNSLFGARGNRESGVSMTCSAITGVTPEIVFLRPEERHAEVLVRPRGLDLEGFSDADYGAFGYYVGKVAQTKNVVIDGIPGRPSFEKLRFLMSPQPVSGGVSICHIVGITPEAPTLGEALGHRKPVAEIAVGEKEMQESFERLTTAKTAEVDLVHFGCPHCTLAEIREIAKLVEGKKLRARLWVSTNESMYVIARRMGLVDILEKAGGNVVTDLCMMGFPFGFLEDPPKVVASNSARAIHYQITGGLSVLGQTPVETLYGSTKQCLQAAIKGKWEG
jgi:phosphomecalonate degydratase large subunit